MARKPKSSRSQFSQTLATLFRRARGDAASSETPAQSAAGNGGSRIRQLIQWMPALSGQRNTILLALFGQTLSVLLKLVPPLATKLAVDYLYVDRPLPAKLLQFVPFTLSRLGWLLAVGAAVIVASLLCMVTSIAAQWLMMRAAVLLQLDMRRRAFEHALRLPLGRIQDLRAGGLASLLREDAGGLASLFVLFTGTIWSSALQIAACVVVLLFIDWRLLLGAAGLAPLLYLSHLVWTRRLFPLYTEVSHRRQELDGRAAETFGGARVVRAFDSVRGESLRFARRNHTMARFEFRLWWYTRGIEMIWGVFVPTALVLLMVYGGVRIFSGKLTLGDLLIFMFCLSLLLQPLSLLVNTLATSQETLARLDRVREMMLEPVDVPNLPDAAPATSLAAISLRGVGFRYSSSDLPILTDINLDIEPGETVALVGPSGSGKSTLCNLIARFYDPTEGEIRYGNRDLRAVDIASYRRLLGIVDQDVILFDGTVAENIAYNLRHASDEEIRAAAHAADADAFIARLDHGYDTIVGERGSRLSGGQRQRIAIARAALRNPQILILDEATSHLDAETEQVVQRGLTLSTRRMTRIIVAHRLHTVRHADRVVVLEDGRILDSGDHATLLERCPRYREMIDAQPGEQTAQLI